MVKNCCVLGCTSNTKRNPAISFFRFPTDTNLAQIWLQLIGRPEFKPSQYSVICQLHFVRDDFTSGSHHYPITGIGGQRKRLKTKAIPTQCLNGCANPEMLAELQMRAKNTVIIKPKTLNTQSPNNSQNKSEAAQLQQLLTSLMPALFANDGGDNFNQTMEQKFQSTSSAALPTYQSITHQNAPTSVSSSLPIISIPTTLQSIPLTPHTTSIANGHATPVLSTSPPLVKAEDMKSNGSSSPLSGRLTMTHMGHNNLSNNRTPSRVHQDLYAELTSSLQALKNNTSVNENNSAMNNSNVVMSSSVREGLQQDPANPAYIIDVDTYQKLLDTVSQKSEKSIQTDRDVQIFALESENKQLKEQLSQYELAFNSLINWTEGSITKEPLEPMICESKLVE